MLLLNIHATAGYQNNASANHKDRTDEVENCCTHTTGGRKNSTSLVNNNFGLSQITSGYIFICCRNKTWIGCETRSFRSVLCYVIV